jgi:hypothetical protein
MHFGTKSYLKSTRNHTAKHARKRVFAGMKTKLGISFRENQSPFGAQNTNK